MAWYLVYPMILGHFQIARLMPRKYDGHSADVISKLMFFIENVAYRFQSKLWRIIHHWFVYSKRCLQIARYLVYPMVPVCSQYIGSGNGFVEKSHHLNQCWPWYNEILFEPVMVSLPTHICVYQPQWIYNAYLQTVAYWNVCYVYISNIGWCIWFPRLH